MAGADCPETAGTERAACKLPRPLEKLSEEERRLFLVLDSLPVPVAIYREQDRILLTNYLLDELLGYAPGELWGMDSNVLFPTLKENRQFRQRLASDREVQAFPLTSRRRDNTTLPTRIWAQRSRCSSRECVFAVLVDVSKQAAALPNTYGPGRRLAATPGGQRARPRVDRLRDPRRSDPRHRRRPDACPGDATRLGQGGFRSVGPVAPGGSAAARRDRRGAAAD